MQNKTHGGFLNSFDENCRGNFSGKNFGSAKKIECEKKSFR
jgi:hypothetical protein